MWNRSRVPYSPPVADGSVLMTIAPGKCSASASFVLEEWKVELVVSDELIRAVVVALKQSHPYETPAYEVWRLEDF
jgi:hypothetical protein